MPSTDEVDRAVELLRQSANYQYFFDQLRAAEWVEPLHGRGFFRHPPAPIREGDYVRFPIWVESRYLARVAAEAPELVARILRELPPTENTRVHEDVVEAARQLPAPLAASLTQQVIPYLESPYHFLLPEKVKELAIHLARGGELTASIALARALLEPSLPEPRTVGDWELPADPRPRFQHPEYEEVLTETLSAIRDADPTAAYRLAGDLLDAALAGKNSGSDRSEDFSYIWRPAIEDSPRNSRHPDLRDDLVRAVRELAAGLSPDPAIVEDLERRDWPVFRRIALHVLRLHLDDLIHAARERIADEARLIEPEQYHEFVLLLRDVMSLSSNEEREALLDRVIAAHRQNGERDAEEQRRRDYGLARTLAALEATLPPRGHELLQQLRTDLELGPDALAAPDYLTADRGGVWVGPTSPLAPGDILGMPDSEVLQYLLTWSAPDDWRAPSAEGLGRSLQEAVKQEPRRFAALAGGFIELDPTYVRSLIQGLRDAAKDGASFEWRAPLELGLWVLDQADEQPADEGDRDRDPNWSWTRRALADLMTEALAIRESSVPFSERDTVWAVLSQLVEDPDPTPDHEEQYGGSNMDPVTLAINTVRGEAMHGLVRYMLWIRHALGETAMRGLEDVPEAREVLDRHLDPDLDPSVAVRSAYGQYFPWLHLVDPAWATSRIGVIFPPEDSARAWFDAAWGAYIVFTQPFDKMAEVLRGVYAEAVERLPLEAGSEGSRQDPHSHLAEHLAVFIARGVLAADDPVVRRFFELASPDLRGHVHQFLGRSFRMAQGPEPAVRRSMALWDARLAATAGASGGDTKELEAFGWWFAAGSVDPYWRVTNLREVLRRTSGRIDYASLVLEELAGLAEQFPAQSLEAVQSIVRGAEEGWEVIAGREHIRAVLAAGLRNPATRERAESLTHELGARGYTEFRSVLDQT